VLAIIHVKGEKTMLIKKGLFSLLTTLLLCLIFCGLAQSEDYEAVSPYEMYFSLTGFIGETEAGEDEIPYFSGTFSKFLCEGKEIAVVTNKAEAGMIETEEYGTIKVSAGTDGSLIVHLTPSQKKKLLEDIRE
jgi:hypothetical protein